MFSFSLWYFPLEGFPNLFAHNNSREEMRTGEARTSLYSLSLCLFEMAECMWINMLFMLL